MTWLRKKEEALEVISRVRELELKAREIAEGALIGLHHSRHRGSSIEFSEHKPYSPGDEIRLIDWKLFAKSDRFFIKQFEDETRIQSYLILDASGSMAYPEEGAKFSKFEYARFLTAGLAYLLLGQGDAVGLAIIRNGKLDWIPCRSGERHFMALAEFLTRAKPEGETRFGPVLFDLISRFKKKSLMVLISDFFDPEMEVEKSLKLARHRKNELAFFQVLTREEMEFPFSQLSWFEGLEGEGRILLEPAQLRRQYLKLIRAWQEKLKRIGQELLADYQLFRIDENPAQILSAYLLRRAQIARRARAR